MKKVIPILNVVGQWVIIVIALVMIPYQLQGRLTTIEVTQKLSSEMVVMRLDKLEKKVDEVHAMLDLTLISDKK